MIAVVEELRRMTHAHAETPMDGGGLVGDCGAYDLRTVQCGPARVDRLEQARGSFTGGCKQFDARRRVASRQSLLYQQRENAYDRRRLPCPRSAGDGRETMARGAEGRQLLTYICGSIPLGAKKS